MAECLRLTSVAPHATSRVAVISLAVAALFGTAPAAGAHGTLNLYGKNAIAGKRGTSPEDG